MKTINTDTEARKTTKTELQNAVDSFRYLMSMVTGGTKEEILRQAPHAIISLQEKADKVAELMLNLSKPALRDIWLCDYASRIPAMLQTYRDRYITAKHPPLAECQDTDRKIWKAPPLRLQRTGAAEGPILRGDMLAESGDVRVEADVNGRWFQITDANSNTAVFSRTKTGWDETGDLRVLEKLSNSDLSAILAAYESVTGEAVK